MITLRELLEKGSDATLLREMIGFAARWLMELRLPHCFQPCPCPRASAGAFLFMILLRSHGLRRDKCRNGETPDHLAEREISGDTDRLRRQRAEGCCETLVNPTAWAKPAKAIDCA